MNTKSPALHRASGIVTAVLALVLAILLTGCSSSAEKHPLPSRLVVGTVYGPSSFFIVRGDTLGYDYDRINDFAKTKGIQLEFTVAPDLNTLVAMLNDGQIDIIAAEVPNNDTYRKQVINCGSVNETRPILAQSASGSPIQDITQLSGKDIYVEAGTKYEALATSINSELGGTVNIHAMPKDSASTDDLLDMVSRNRIQYTIIDSDIALFDASNYDSIDVSLTLGGPQTASWAVSPQNQWLADSINAWSNSMNARTYSKKALERYSRKSKVAEEPEVENLAHEIPHLGQRPSERWASLSKRTGSHTPYMSVSNPRSNLSGRPSSYDQLFMAYAGSSGWDWKLLSAIARIESNYNPNATSWAGARGLMQVMPGTARGYGVSADNLYDPETSVRLAAKCLRDMNNTLAKRIHNRDERLKFVLAAYNAGTGHVLDAIALAQKYGKDPQVWYGNVEQALLWKSNPQYYNDPVCRFGYCRGRETVSYVRAVQQVYTRL